MMHNAFKKLSMMLHEHHTMNPLYLWSSVKVIRRRGIPPSENLLAEALHTKPVRGKVKLKQLLALDLPSLQAGEGLEGQVSVPDDALRRSLPKKRALASAKTLHSYSQT